MLPLYFLSIDMLLLYVFHKSFARCYSKVNKKTKGFQKSRGILRKVERLMKKILAMVNEFFKEYYESFAEEPVL